MKKLFCCALTIFALLAVSCQKENYADAASGDMSEVTFSINLPIELSTKSIGDGSSAKELYYAVFSQEGKYVQSLAQTSVVAVEGKSATLNLRLVKNYTYSIVFWAQAKNAPYKFSPETGTVTVSYGGNANDETRDAFCKCHTFTVPGAATFNETVTLRRPFAQINFGASDFGKITELDLSMESTVYISSLPDKYDILKGVVSGNASTMLTLNTVPAQFSPVEKLYVGEREYGYVSMNYILAPENEYDQDGNVVVDAKELASVTATFAYNGDNLKINVPNVPYQRNFRTNIIGSFFTSDATFTIVVDDKFHQPDFKY